MRYLPFINLQTVIIEPREGYSDQDLINILSVWGAENIYFLTEGFIQAQIRDYYIPCLHKIAIIHTKHLSQIRELPGIRVWTKK